MSLKKMPTAPSFDGHRHPAIQAGLDALERARSSGVNAAAREDELPSALMEAVRTVGAQVKEHRTALEDRMNGLQATVQNTQQAVAKMESNGGPSLGAAAARPLSALVLEELEPKLEQLDSGAQRRISMSLKSLHPNAATITSTGLPMPPERDPEFYGQAHRPWSIRDLLVQRPTGHPSIEYIRSTGRTGSAAIQAAEGDQKAELAFGFELLQSPVRTIACWVPASRQILSDAIQLGTYIDLELRDALRMTEDAQLLKGTGTGVNILGMWSQATAFNRGTASGGAVAIGDKPLDTMRRAITQLQLARGNATGIVINPLGLEKLELEKDAEGRYMMAFDVTDSNGRTVVWRVPVVVTDAIGADEWMLGDFTRAARLYDRQQATVVVATEHADFFTRNLVAILCEERVALTVNRPEMLIIGTFAPVTP